jgi:hypothetical protein
MNNNENNINSSESGQGFIEFMLLLLVVLTLAAVMLNGINAGLKKRWADIVNVIAAPTPSKIELK